MSIRKIIQLKRPDFLSRDTSLRKPSASVEEFDDALRSKIKDLVDTFEAHQIAVGLAAPQIGFQIRATVINAQKGKPRPHTVLINPQIANRSDVSEEKFESCMSLPLSRGKVNRHKEIDVSFQDEYGKAQTIKADGFLARVIQHEIDHLDGILYIDRMSNIDALEPSEIPAVIDRVGGGE